MFVYDEFTFIKSNKAISIFCVAPTVKDKNANAPNSMEK